MNKDLLLLQLQRVAFIAELSKVGRFFYAPFRYVYALSFWKLIYPLVKREVYKTVPVFFGNQMVIGLPAATDIFLTGGKSHESEIRLAKWMILQMQPGQNYLDIGAHYGYFSLLAAHLVGSEGQVKAFEPSTTTYKILQQNVTLNAANCVGIHQQAVSDQLGTLTFYEFPNLYSEYNSIDAAQFEGSQWFKEYTPQKVTVEATTLDAICQTSFVPNIIKIDVEGAEDKVIAGGATALKTHCPMVVMEFLSGSRTNNAHEIALRKMTQMGYKTYVIDKEGVMQLKENVMAYMEEHKIESDNIVFKK